MSSSHKHKDRKKKVLLRENTEGVPPMPYPVCGISCLVPWPGRGQGGQGKGSGGVGWVSGILPYSYLGEGGLVPYPSPGQRAELSWGRGYPVMVMAWGKVGQGVPWSWLIVLRTQAATTITMLITPTANKPLYRLTFVK